MTPLSFAAVLYTTPRVGQNAVLRCLRSVIPGADEWGAAQPIDGKLVMSINRPPPSNLVKRGFDLTNCRWGDPVYMRRRDKIAQAISWAVAAQTGRFTSEVKARGEPEYRRQDVQQALDTIVDQEHRWMSVLPDRYLEVWYEDHVETDPRDAARLILRFWGFDGEPADPGLVRVESDVKARWRQQWDTGRG